MATRSNQRSSKEHVTACLIRLASVTKPHWQGDAAMELTLAAYVDDLCAIDPKIVQFACERWGRTKPKFPYLSELLALCEQLQTPQVEARPPPTDEGAVCRNEAILLLAGYHAHVAGLLAHNRQVYRQFVAEAGRLWGRVRPPGGLAEVQKHRGQRAVYGAALEAWARSYLGEPPIDTNYVIEGVREAHRAMTGSDLLDCVGDALSTDEIEAYRAQHATGAYRGTLR